MKTHMTRELTVRHHFNWIILTAPGAPCGGSEIHSQAVVVLFDVVWLISLVIYCLNTVVVFFFSIKV